MKIYYDSQVFSFQNFGGISRYFYELISRIKISKNDAVLGGKYSNNYYFEKLRGGSRFIPNWEFPKKNLTLFYINSLFCENIKKADFDVFHPTYYHPYFIKELKGRPYVVTVFDMIHEIFGRDYKNLRNRTANFKKRTIESANKVIAISDNTKNDLMKFYGLDEKNIEVTHLASSLEGVVPKKVKNLPARYILFVGTRGGYKNFDFFLESVKDILLGEDLSLVCYGARIFDAQENKKLGALKLRDKVTHLPYINESELAYVYKKAMIYAIPSLYEGFGITILEAFSQGCPIIASGEGSISEVAGNAAAYIDPQDRQSIRNTLERLINNRNELKALSEKGTRRLKKFSWDRCVRETGKVYVEASK